MVAASKITLSDLKENEILGILFIISLNGYAYYLRRTNDKLVLFQENKYTMYELQKKDYGRLKDILYSNAKKGPAIIVSDNIIDQKLKSKMPNNYKYLEVENYGRAVYDGALMKSQFMSGITPKFMEVADFCGPTFYELPGKPLFKIFDPYQILPYCNSYDIEGISDRITVSLYLSFEKSMKKPISKSSTSNLLCDISKQRLDAYANDLVKKAFYFVF